MPFANSWPTSRPPVNNKSQNFYGLQLMSDGTIIGQTASTKDWEFGDPSTLTSLNVKTGKFMTLVTQEDRTPDSLIGAVARDSESIVWVDTKSASLTDDDWALRVKNLKTGKVKVLAEAPPAPNGPPSFFDRGAYPELHSDSVFIVGDSGDAKPDGRPLPSIYRVAADGSSRLTEYIHGAEHPRVVGNTLYYHRGSSARTRDLVTGVDRRIASAVINSSAELWNFAEGSFVAARRDSGDYSVRILGPDGHLFIVKGVTSELSGLSVTSKWASFDVQAPGDTLPRHFLVDLQRKRLLIIKPRVSYQVAVGTSGQFFYMTRANTSKKTWDRIAIYGLPQ
jgi:hypothetical protein